MENDEWMERQGEGNEERNGGALPTRKSQKPKVAIASVLRILHYKHTAFHRTFAREMYRAAIAHTHRHCIRTTTLLGSARIKPLAYYYYCYYYYYYNYNYNYNYN